MNYNQPNNTCLFNTLYVQYVEEKNKIQEDGIVLQDKL